jgi:hypothetical protein
MRRIIVNLIVVTRELTKLFAFYQIWFDKNEYRATWRPTSETQRGRYVFFALFLLISPYWSIVAPINCIYLTSSRVNASNNSKPDSGHTWVNKVICILSNRIWLNSPPNIHEQCPPHASQPMRAPHTVSLCRPTNEPIRAQHTIILSKKKHGRTMAEASVFLAFEDIFIKHTQQVWQWGVKQHFPINANVFYYTVNLFPYRFTAYSHHTKHKICNVLLFHNPQDSAGEGHLFFSGPNQDLSHPISLLPTPPRASYPRFPEHTILHYNFLSGFNNISSDFQQFDHQTDR